MTMIDLPIVQAVADDPNVSDDLRNTLVRQAGKQRHRQYLEVPAKPSAFGSLGDLTERSGEGVQAPEGTTERGDE